MPEAGGGCPRLEAALSLSGVPCARPYQPCTRHRTPNQPCFRHRRGGVKDEAKKLKAKYEEVKAQLAKDALAVQVNTPALPPHYPRTIPFTPLAPRTPLTPLAPLAPLTPLTTPVQIDELEGRVKHQESTVYALSDYIETKGAAARSKCPTPWQCPKSAPAPPQGAPGGSGWLGAPRGETGRLGAQPLPRVLELAASNAAHFPAF